MNIFPRVWLIISYHWFRWWRGTEPFNNSPDSKVHVAHMGPTWVLSVPGGPHVGPMSLAVREGELLLKVVLRCYYYKDKIYSRLEWSSWHLWSVTNLSKKIFVSRHIWRSTFVLFIVAFAWAECFDMSRIYATLQEIRRRFELACVFRGLVPIHFKHAKHACSSVK